MEIISSMKIAEISLHNYKTEFNKIQESFEIFSISQRNQNISFLHEMEECNRLQDVQLLRCQIQVMETHIHSVKNEIDLLASKNQRISSALNYLNKDMTRQFNNTCTIPLSAAYQKKFKEKLRSVFLCDAKVVVPKFVMPIEAKLKSKSKKYNVSLILSRTKQNGVAISLRLTQSLPVITVCLQLSWKVLLSKDVVSCKIITDLSRKESEQLMCLSPEEYQKILSLNASLHIVASFTI